MKVSPGPPSLPRLWGESFAASWRFCGSGHSLACGSLHLHIVFSSALLSSPVCLLQGCLLGLVFTWIIHDDIASRTLVTTSWTFFSKQSHIHRCDRTLRVRRQMYLLGTYHSTYYTMSPVSLLEMEETQEH